MKKVNEKIRKIIVLILLIILIFMLGRLSVIHPNLLISKTQDGMRAQNINRLDINKDGVVDITDVVALKRHVLVETINDKESDWYIDNQEIYTEITKDKTQSYQGYYADVDSDGTVDGVIYVDLLAQSGTSGRWNNDSWNYSNYTIPSVESEELKDYVISDIEHKEEAFGTHNVIQMKKGSKGKDRFYVMSINDVKTDKYEDFYWYYNAYDEINEVGKMSDFETTTSTDFGTGRENTYAIKQKWDNEAYGVKNDKDIWGNIENEISKGWFIPSSGELATFLQYYDISKENYKKFKLNDWYASSSQSEESYAWGAILRNGYMNNYLINFYGYIRLSTTF